MSARALETINDREDDDRLAVPIIALVEAWDVARKRRRDYVPFDEVMRAVYALDVIVVPLTLPIVHRLVDEWNDYHDMIILATALDMKGRHGEVAIISSDRNMRFDQTLIPCIW